MFGLRHKSSCIRSDYLIILISLTFSPSHTIRSRGWYLVCLIFFLLKQTPKRGFYLPTKKRDRVKRGRHGVGKHLFAHWYGVNHPCGQIHRNSCGYFLVFGYLSSGIMKDVLNLNKILTSPTFYQENHFQ